MNKRWTCPRCGGGKLAPGRARKNDTRRYCLPCSDATGRLVERTCPSAEAKREAKTAARKTAAVRGRERERQRQAERHTVDGMDVRAEWARLCSLGMVRSRLRDQRRRSIPLTVGWSKFKDYTTGHAYYGGPVHVTFYPGITRHEAHAILAHELAHSVGLERGHGDGFRRTFVLIVQLAYGVKVDPKAGDKYEMHVRVERALREAAGGEPSGRDARAA